jgi:hypothetical protein
MRFDVARDARSCLGCGRQCADSYNFCGQCLSRTYSSARPGLSPQMRNVLLWLMIFLVGGLSYWISKLILES